jgi:hypothetical protein
MARSLKIMVSGYPADLPRGWTVGMLAEAGL